MVDYLQKKVEEVVDSFVEWFNSKKTKDMIYGSGLVAVMGYMNIQIEYIAIVAGLCGIKISAQGLSDMGKEKAKICETNKEIKKQV